MNQVTPSGLTEALALERIALAEHEHNAVAHWQAGAYGAARDEQRLAADARRYISELESRGWWDERAKEPLER